MQIVSYCLSIIYSPALYTVVALMPNPSKLVHKQYSECIQTHVEAITLFWYQSIPPLNQATSILTSIFSMGDNNAIAFACSSSTSLPNVTIYIKLMSSNQLLWKTQLVPLLCAYDLHDHVDGFTPMPLTGNTTDYQDWLRKDHLVLSWIICFVFEGILHQIIGANTTYDVGHRLTVAYAFGFDRLSRKCTRSLQFFHGSIPWAIEPWDGKNLDLALN